MFILGIILYVLGAIIGLSAIGRTVKGDISPTVLGLAMYGGLAMAMLGVVLMG